MVDSGPTKNSASMVDRSLTKLSTKTEISLNFYALLFREVVNYCDSRVKGTTEDLHSKLADMGKHVASRLDHQI